MYLGQHHNCLSCIFQRTADINLTSLEINTHLLLLPDVSQPPVVADHGHGTSLMYSVFVRLNGDASFDSHMLGQTWVHGIIIMEGLEHQ